MTTTSKQRGFSLLEIMLVTVIMVVFAMMAISYSRSKAVNTRIDRTAAQMQQILQAASSYYIDNSTWPTCNQGETADTAFNTCQIQALINTGYLPTPMGASGKSGESVTNSWGNPYESAWSNTVGQTFQLRTDATSSNYATILRGLLPLTSVNGTVVQTAINIPGYNYNASQNLKSPDAYNSNYTSTYNSGSCVKTPQCPTNMEPRIIVSPLVVSGTTLDTATGTVSSKAYDIQNFYAYAEGGMTGVLASTKPLSPVACASASSATYQGKPEEEVCQASTTQLYWRVCLAGKTSNGDFQNYIDANGYRSLQVTVMTYCVPSTNSSSTLQSSRGGGTSLYK